MTTRTILLTFLLCLALPGTAAAAVVGFTFVFDEGPLAGQTGSGTYEVDGPAKPSVTYFADTGLLAFDVVIDGVEFSVSDDTAFPHLPGIRVYDNKVTQLDYNAEIDPPGGPELNFFIYPDGGNGPVNYIHFTPLDGEHSYGYFTSFVLLDTEPGGLGNFLPGSGGIGGFKFEPVPPPSPGINRTLSARARKYGVTVSELFSLMDRSGCTRRCEADGNRTQKPQ
ncbi:hypothetical protein [Nitrospira sp. M1]